MADRDRCTAEVWLARIAWAEAVSLVALLVNLATVHAGPVAALVGPVHGSFYAVCIAFASPLPRRRQWLSVVPGLGGLLASRGAATDEPDVQKEPDVA